MNTIGFVQVNSGFAGANYFPYSVGLFQAYYLEYGQNIATTKFLEPIFTRDTIENIIPNIIEADMVFFSTYAWNLQISLAIAKALKEIKPEIITIFGGPQVPPDAIGFLKENTCIDIACRGEGERINTLIIDSLYDGDWSHIPSISYYKDGKFHTSNEFERVVDLDTLPSPYLTGVFDSLVRQYRDHDWLGLWETNRGCPYSCAYCDWGAVEQKRMHKFSLQRAKDELKWFSDNKIEFIFCCDSNFGMYERDIELAQYAAELHEKTGYPKALSVQNAKNSNSRIIKLQEILAEAGLNKGVTLAMQSVNADVLKNIGRKNIPFTSFAELQYYFTQKGIETYTDIILCLPGETYTSFTEGIDTIINHGQLNRIQFINLSVLPNSSMASPEFLKNYGIETVLSKGINIHGKRPKDDEISELQELVIGSNTMPQEDWRRVRTWSWMCGFLFFNKLLQIPLIIFSQNLNVPISKMLNAFLVNDESYPLFSEYTQFLLEAARKIQNGGEEYYYSEDALAIYWPYDEYLFIDICKNGKIDAFYDECHRILEGVISQYSDRVDAIDILEDSIALNKIMMKTPSKLAKSTLKTRYNILEYYNAIKIAQPMQLERVDLEYTIIHNVSWDSWDEWMRKVVWWGNKKAAYWWAPTSSIVG